MDEKETDNIQPQEQQEWKWCLVGNIVQEREYGENHEIKHGTKHFSPGTKVYCAQGLWGDGYENIVVIGKHRKSPKYTKLIMQRKHIENFRCQKVFQPVVLKLMNRDNDFWDNSVNSRDWILKMAEGLNKENENTCNS